MASGIRAGALLLMPNSLDAVRALVSGMDALQRAELSADWLARIVDGTADAWTLGFTMVAHATGATVGTCGYKSPPGLDGVVEIAYGVSHEYEGRGYATDAAMGMVEHALASGHVRVVRAHTLSNEGASARVLAKSGFRLLHQVIDHDDGAVWRWEREKNTA